MCTAGLVPRLPTQSWCRVRTSLGPRPKTNPSVDRFQYRARCMGMGLLSLLTGLGRSQGREWGGQSPVTFVLLLCSRQPGGQRDSCALFSPETSHCLPRKRQSNMTSPWWRREGLGMRLTSPAPEFLAGSKYLIVNY